MFVWLAVYVALAMGRAGINPTTHATLSVQEAVVENGWTVNNGKKWHIAPKVIQTFVAIQITNGAALTLYIQAR